MTSVESFGNVAERLASQEETRFTVWFLRTKDVNVTWQKIGAIRLALQYCPHKLRELVQCASGPALSWYKTTPEDRTPPHTFLQPLQLPYELDGHSGGQ
ncbi:hypothetical protein AVEN_211486-1 [Araneus ventricosus]|uniref:Uncharacterized protein n=1 Tax=Araneus ventricosus TaxID=182803 RepID=A0A4Y2MZT6_ARAVE|nr:hypothetical protein AVEN_211486-1 [Araneus ventricosus]